MPYAVSKAEFARLVEEALKELPPQFQEFLEEVPVQIEWAPSPRLLKQLDMEEDELLMGLYQGSSLMNRSETEGRGTPMPNHILIFQEDHELVCDSEQELVEEVRKTVLHEIGHHFGMSEEDLDQLGYG
ncbi:MAG TPA: metallopeptidase family protein [Tepidisphaeraceae bacterium]|jgi:predicted Zn-dependent protease with MMP-like domain